MSRYFRYGFLAPASEGSTRQGATAQTGGGFKAALLANAGEYDYLAACNKGKEVELPSVIMLPRHV